MTVASLSNQSVTIENPSGTRDRYGQESFGAPATAYVRFERTYKVIKTENRERDPVHALIGLPSDVAIARGARVTYQGTVYKVIQLSEAVDGLGNVHHREAMLQEWSYA